MMEENAGLSFDSTIKAKDARKELHLPILAKKENNMSNDQITFNPWKNQYAITVHEGSYALNIKYYHHNYVMTDEDYAEAFEYAQEVFFNRALELACIYGYDGIDFSGRSAGWLKPFYGNHVYAKAITDDYISYMEHVEQGKMFSMFELIKSNIKDIKMILNYSSDYEEFEKNMAIYLSL